MAQKKLVRFAELETFQNVLQYPEDMAGNWYQHFGNANPITLELACGKGEYTVGLAKLHPSRNFIGVDIKGNRIWVGAKKAIKEGLQNVAFLRSQIERITEFFAEGEVSEIWITFPDPQLRYSKAKKRLTHPRFLRLYQKVLADGGVIHLKTDSPDLYRFTNEVLTRYNCTVIADHADVYGLPKVADELSITTHYESLDIAQSNRIHYLSFTLIGDLGGAAEDEALKEAIRYELSKDDMFYTNEEGRTVMTEEYLLLRGYCCSNGCLNCPYEYKNVPEPRRSQLLNERKARQQNSKNSD